MPKGIFKRSEKHLEHSRTVNIGREPWNKGKKGVQKVSKETRRKLSKIKTETPVKYWSGKKFNYEHRRKISEAVKGDKSPHWRGGVNAEKRRNYKSFEYNNWKIAVFARDKNRCQWCGTLRRKGKKIQADHIFSYKLYPKKRYEIKNGRTLCKECHLKRTSKQLPIIRKCLQVQ